MTCGNGSWRAVAGLRQAPLRRSATVAAEPSRNSIRAGGHGSVMAAGPSRSSAIWQRPAGWQDAVLRAWPRARRRAAWAVWLGTNVALKGNGAEHRRHHGPRSGIVTRCRQWPRCLAHWPTRSRTAPRGRLASMPTLTTPVRSPSGPAREPGQARRDATPQRAPPTQRGASTHTQLSATPGDQTPERQTPPAGRSGMTGSDHQTTPARTHPRNATAHVDRICRRASVAGVHAYALIRMFAAVLRQTGQLVNLGGSASRQRARAEHRIGIL